MMRTITLHEIRKRDPEMARFVLASSSRAPTGVWRAMRVFTFTSRSS